MPRTRTVLACVTAWTFSEGAAGQFLGLWAGEAQHLRELIRDALERLRGRV